VSTWPGLVAFAPDHHRTDRFRCGVEQLDVWLRAYAGQSQRRDAARTFVVLEEDRVIAYCTLVASEIDHGGATNEVRRGLSRHFPIPVCLLARLAVDERHQRTGLGRHVLRHALGRALQAATEVGMRAVVVDALGGASGFYRRFGFAPVDADGTTLMITVAHLAAVIGQTDG